MQFLNLHLLDYSLFNTKRLILGLLLTGSMQPFLMGQSIDIGNIAVQQMLIKADSSWQNEDASSAINLYQKAFAIQRQEECWENLLNIGLKIIDIYKSQAEYEVAQQSADNLIKLIPPHLTNSELIAKVYHQKGLMFYYDNYQDSAAIANYKKALHIRLHHSDATEDIIQGMLNIGESYPYLSIPNALDSSQHYLETAFVKTKLINIPIKLKRTLYQLLGRLYDDSGDSDKANNLLNYVVESYHLDSANIKNCRNYGIALDDYGKVLVNLEDFTAAADTFTRALSILKSCSDVDSTTTANTFNFNGLCFLKMERYSAASEYFQEAILFDPSPKYILNLASSYNKLENYQTALDALHPLLQSTDPRFLSKVHDNLGDAYLGLHQTTTAIDHYNQSITLLVPNFQPTRPAENPSVQQIQIDQRGILTTLYSKAKAWQQLHTAGDSTALTRAYTTYQVADSLIHQIRRNFVAQQSKLSLNNTTRPIYEQAIQVSQQLFTATGDTTFLENVYQLMEKSKAIVLLDAAQHVRAQTTLGIDNEEEKALNLRISSFAEQLFENPNQLDLQDSLIRLHARKDSLIQQMESDHATYYYYKYSNAVPTIAAVSAELAEDAVLVEYFVGDSLSFALVIQPTGKLTLHTLPIKRTQLQEQVNDFVRSIYEPFSGKDSVNPLTLAAADTLFAQKGKQLYDLLLAPLKLSDRKALTIVADDVLNVMPFSALLCQSVPADFYGYYSNTDHYDFVLYHHPISYAHSVSTLELMKQPLATATSTRAQLLVFNTQEFDTQIDLLEQQFGQFNQFCQSLYNRSTRAYFEENAEQYRFLHFSVHGVVNNEDPEQSHFLLRHPDVAKRPLYLSTIYNTPLQAEMVVTSSCDAGIGKITRSEGALSLARGFSYAGAQSIITSLWEIKDGPSGALLADFYAQLRSGKDKTTALNTAQQTFMQTQGDHIARPYYWAAFVPIGNMAAVEMPRQWSMGFKIMAATLLGLLLLGGYWWWSKRGV